METLENGMSGGGWGLLDHGRSLLAAEEAGSYHIPFTFEELLMLCTTLILIYLFGRIAGFLGLPELIGHLCAGILVGPHGVAIAPKPDALMLAGELGLVLMVMEAGMEVDLNQLALVGPRGLCVAFLGSLLPLGIGFGCAYGIFALPLKEALAVGASLAPTSMGISLKVLAEGKVLNTPIGQLIIAAAVIDDVIALVLLSELEALETPTAANFIIPIVSSVAFILGVGSFAVFLVPRVLRWALPKIPEQHSGQIVLGLTLITTYALLPATHYGKSSYLLGAFLGGLCFCTAEPLMEAWHNNAYQVLSWLLRVFFACTLGFEIPIADLWKPAILIQTAAYLLAFFGKFVTGFFASPRTSRNWCIIGFAMSAWGEFAFVVATTSREMGTMSEDTFGAVVLAVLLSAFYSPLAVQLSITFGRGGKKKGLPCSTDQSAADQEVLHPVYYKAMINVKSSWGLTDKLLRGIHNLGLGIVEFRIQAAGEWSNFLLFLRDQDLKAPADSAQTGQNDQITGKTFELRMKFADMLNVDRDDMSNATALLQDTGPSNELILLIQRWIPTLDPLHPEDDDWVAYQEARDACAPPPPANAPPRTLGGLVRQSLTPGGLVRNSFNPAGASNKKEAALNRKSAGYALKRQSGPSDTGMERVAGGPPPVGLGPGKNFALARLSGQPIYHAPERRSMTPYEYYTAAGESNFKESDEDMAEEESGQHGKKV